MSRREEQLVNLIEYRKCKSDGTYYYLTPDDPVVYKYLGIMDIKCCSCEPMELQNATLEQAKIR